MRYVTLALFPLISDISLVQGKYRNWAKSASFISKLPGDVKKRKAATEEATRTLDHDLRKMKHSERVVPYSDKLFHQAAVEWLVATDQVWNSFHDYFLPSHLILSLQPIQALEHPKFKTLIDVASRATNGIKIPGRKATWVEIMCLFKNHLVMLKAQLNVRVLLIFLSFLTVSQGSTVQGEVSLTCDAWQASNTDGYFAVTAHWIDEPTPGTWELKSAIIGFTRLNNAHNGERLGQALFKIIKRVGIEHKVSLSSLSHSCRAYPLLQRLAMSPAITQATIQQ